MHISMYIHNHLFWRVLHGSTWINWVSSAYHRARIPGGSPVISENAPGIPRPFANKMAKTYANKHMWHFLIYIVECAYIYTDLWKYVICTDLLHVNIYIHIYIYKCK